MAGRLQKRHGHHALLVLWLLVAVVGWGEDRISPSELDGLRTGDIVLHSGEGFFSDFIELTLGGTTFSHCAMVISVNPVVFVHSVSGTFLPIDGVQSATVEYFNTRSRDSSIVVVRPRLSERQRQILAEVARDDISAGIPFNGNFDDRSIGFYCTQYLVHLLQVSGFWGPAHSLHRSRGIIDFSNFLGTPDFVVLYDHRSRT